MKLVHNNVEIEVENGKRAVEIYKKEIEESNKKILGCRVNNEIKSLDFPINSNAKIDFIDYTSKDGRRIYRRGLVFVAGKAFNEVYKEALNYDMRFDQFDITNLIINADLYSSKSQTIFLNKQNPFYKAVLNKCWSTLRAAEHTYIKGGEILATGDMYDEIKSDSKQRFMVLSFAGQFNEGEVITLLDDSDTPVFAYKSDRTYTNLVFSSPVLEEKT